MKVVEPSGVAHPLLTVLDCPECLAGGGLVPQRIDRRQYLCCRLCRRWYPIEDEIAVLLPAKDNPGVLTRPVGVAVPLDLERRPPHSVDMKALVYSYQARMDEFVAGFGLGHRDLIVDVGCSTGSLAAWMHPEQTYIGFDISLSSLRFARAASGRYFVQADATRLPIKTGSVPFFVSREVLEHLDDASPGARELARIGKQGVIVVPTLDFPFLYDPVNWVLTRSGRRARFGIYGYEHNDLKDIAGWRDVIQKAGFDVVREASIGTGLVLNAFDNFWHGLYSWRSWENLPRYGAPLHLAHAALAVGRAFHRIDSRLYSRRTVSRAFAVTPRSPARAKD